ncbi:MAG TPA: hypothetical protein VGU25_09700 [Acidobacteriaceae bacterium]|nr:hypothetical protein [Acidobacteriaceae bacterium]
MEITLRSVLTIIHGMGFGALFLLAFSGAFFELVRIGQGSGSPANERAVRLYLLAMTILAWLTVLTGAYIIYPWYRAVAPPGADLASYPQAFLKSQPTTIGWHSLGMEWKEHVAWIAPIAITMVTAVFFHYGRQLRNHLPLRRAVLVFVAVAFFAAAIAGFSGAMINKYAPVQGGHLFHLLRGA